MKCPKCGNELIKTTRYMDKVTLRLVRKREHEDLVCRNCLESDEWSYHYLFIPQTNTLYLYRNGKWYEIEIEKEKVMFT